MDRFKKILVPTDLEATSRPALEIAVMLAQKFESAITLFHAWTPPAAPYVQDSSWPAQELAEAAERALDDAHRWVKDRYPSVEQRIACGAPGWLIVELVKEEGFDLIVMGTHGRRGVSRLVLGSVAERVVRYAPCPVLTVPA